MLSCEEAWRRIAAVARPLGVEQVARRDALGRFLAVPLLARTDLPAADVSALDGFALDGEPLPGAVLRVGETIPAGASPGARLEPGTATRIWTGAPVPAGADRVVAVEDCETVEPGLIRVLRTPPRHHAIRRQGEVARSGDELLAAGSAASPAALSLAAGQGVESLTVVRAPRVAVLATGDEVVPPETTPGPGRLRDSHTDFLLAAGRRLELEFTPLGIAPDDPDQLLARLAAGMEGADVLLTCGGVSKGGADHVRGALERLGCDRILHGVAMQPGKPLLVASRGPTLVFALPGNPASVMVSFRLFVRPALERMLGGSQGFWSGAATVELTGELPAGRGRDRFLPALRERDERGDPGRPRARPLRVAGSHDQVAFARADLLLRVEGDDSARDIGASVEAIEW